MKKKMNKEDKLRFEIGECFNRLSQKEIDDLIKLFNKIYKKTVDEYGYEGDRPYYDSMNEFCEKLLDKYESEEDFIQAIIECAGCDCYGWALTQLNDSDIYKYARERMIKKLKDSGWDEANTEHYISKSGRLG